VAAVLAFAAVTQVDILAREADSAAAADYSADQADYRREFDGDGRGVDHAVVFFDHLYFSQPEQGDSPGPGDDADGGVDSI
jgi:hypothetical protein